MPLKQINLLGQRISSKQVRRTLGALSTFASGGLKDELDIAKRQTQVAMFGAGAGEIGKLGLRELVYSELL
jgi:isopentenyl diphosphate isomerase/L-lactate dehydrogenase-like FMN-dependent dehydrogenase